MDPIDNELQKELAEGPLKDHGFNDQLKRRIEVRLDEPRANPRRWMPLFSGISAAVIIAGVLLAGGWQEWFGKQPSPVGPPSAGQELSSAPPVNGVQEQGPIRSAVLIGLRTDHPAAGRIPEYSTYRTVLLGPQQGELHKIAEGPDILMPYKMDFWKIVQTSPAVDTRMLGAFLADGSAKTKPEEAKQPAAPLKLSEKLIFAGNRYLTVEQTGEQKLQGRNVQAQYVWVKELQYLTSVRPQESFSPLQDPHLTLKEVFGDKVTPVLSTAKIVAPPAASAASQPQPQPETAGDSWAIVRDQGAWVAEAASYDARAEQDTVRYRLQKLPLTLPESVAAYDRLTPTWSEVQQIRPGAKDAFSSPNQEMAAIISDRDIVVYPIQGRLLPTPLLSLGLLPNESVVMVQWAADEPYIEMWKQKAKLLLEN